MLVIDGNNNNEDGTGNNSREPNLERPEDEKEKNVPGGHQMSFRKT
jgi:hypothetical protein